jgi:hypothetical protein
MPTATGAIPPLVGFRRGVWGGGGRRNKFIMEFQANYCTMCTFLIRIRLIYAVIRIMPVHHHGLLTPAFLWSLISRFGNKGLTACLLEWDKVLGTNPTVKEPTGLIGANVKLTSVQYTLMHQLFPLQHRPPTEAFTFTPLWN